MTTALTVNMNQTSMMESALSVCTATANALFTVVRYFAGAFYFGYFYFTTANLRPPC